jgi:hypothetical protein
MMIATRIITVAFASLGVSHACTCSDPTVLVAKQRSQAVFRGTITALRPTGKDYKAERAFGDTEKIAVFRVSRIWKGEVGPTFEMPAVVEFGGCWGFVPQFLKVGAELLVYAQRPPGMDYQTNICSRTRFIKYAEKDLAELGVGEEPKRDTRLRNPNSK